MNWNEDHNAHRQKTKLLTGIGCFFGVVILGLLVIVALFYIFISKPLEETQMQISHSPNNINDIKIVMVADFPDPTLRIYYGDEYIAKLNMPNDITVEWKNDYEANVILTRHGRDPDIIELEFN